MQGSQRSKGRRRIAYMCWCACALLLMAAPAAKADTAQTRVAKEPVPEDAPEGSRYLSPENTPKTAPKTAPKAAPKEVPRAAPKAAPDAPPIAPPMKSQVQKPKKSESGWHLNVEARSDVPVLMGAHLVFEIPAGFRITSTFGILPPFFADLINVVLINAGAYNQQTGDIIKAALSSSMVWRLHVGWRPFARFGFYIEVGYGLVTLGGTTSNDQLLAAAVGQSIPPQLQGQIGKYNVKSSLHMFDAEIGYRWLFASEHLLFRIAIGFAGTVGSKTDVTPQDPNAVSNQVAIKTAEYLDKLYRTYIFTPTVSVGLGYRFF